MKFLERLERKFAWLGAPNVPVVLIAGQVLVFVLARPEVQGPQVVEKIAFIPRLVLEQGEFWRLITYVFMPPLTNPLFALIFWHLFYLYCSALTQYWGAFRLNLFLLVGYLATTAAAFFGTGPANVIFLSTTVFLAFAYVFPDFTLNLFFILPIRVKWLALLAWIGLALGFIQGSLTTRVEIAAAVLNFFLFFGPQIAGRVRDRQRRSKFEARTKRPAVAYRHKCTVCGLTSADDPKMQFRYCSKCAGELCYCSRHIGEHDHVET